MSPGALLCLLGAAASVAGGIAWQRWYRRYRRERARRLALDCALEAMVFDVSGTLLRCLDPEGAEALIGRALSSFWSFQDLGLYLRDADGWCDLTGRRVRPPSGVEGADRARLPPPDGGLLLLPVGGPSGPGAVLAAGDARPQPVIAEWPRERQERILDILRGQIVLGLQRVLLFRTLRRLARTDPLTGLWRRWYGRSRLRELVEDEPELAVAMIDIDGFKEVNDRHGHGAGDEALRTLAEHLRARVRTEDLLCRYGGEEFLLILHRTAPDGARRTAERLRASVAAAGFGDGIRLTVSIGLAWARPDDRYEDLVRRSDEALYAAKGEGRDRVAWLQDDAEARGA